MRLPWDDRYWPTTNVYHNQHKIKRQVLAQKLQNKEVFFSLIKVHARTRTHFLTSLTFFFFQNIFYLPLHHLPDHFPSVLKVLVVPVFFCYQQYCKWWAGVNLACQWLSQPEIHRQLKNLLQDNTHILFLKSNIYAIYFTLKMYAILNYSYKTSRFKNNQL